MAPRATFTESKESFEAALLSIFAGKPEEAEIDLAKLLVPEIHIRAEDEEFDFASFAAHTRWLRGNLPKVTLKIVQFLRDGNQLALRHFGETTIQDGSLRKSETFMFVEIAEDGRLSSIVEAVRQQRAPTSAG